MKSVKVQFIAVIGLAALLGFVVARGGVHPWRRRRLSRKPIPSRFRRTSSTAPFCRSRNRKISPLPCSTLAMPRPAAVPGQSPGRRAQRADRADRRHGLRPVQRLWRADSHADAGTSGQEGLQIQSLPHHRALLADAHALLTGRNHHVCNMGSITETATAFPGQTGQRPNSVAPLAEMLRLNGYSTAAFGKSHETAAWEVSPSGPTDRWPTRSGFDKFYGFIGGEANQWAPAPVRRHDPDRRRRTIPTTI